MAIKQKSHIISEIFNLLIRPIFFASSTTTSVTITVQTFYILKIDFNYNDNIIYLKVVIIQYRQISFIVRLLASSSFVNVIFGH